MQQCGAAAAGAGPQQQQQQGAVTPGWPQLDAVWQQLQQGATVGDLQGFFQDWDAAAGGPCRSFRQQALRCLQATGPIPWQELHLAADALQEISWEMLHTGHWMDVDVAWRDAYALFTVLSVLARLALSEQPHQPQLPPVQAAQETLPPQQQQQLLRDAMRQLDLAAMMGGPRFRRWVDLLLGVVDERLQLLLQQQQQHVLPCKRKASAGAAADAAPAEAAAGAGGSIDAQQAHIGGPQAERPSKVVCAGQAPAPGSHVAAPPDSAGLADVAAGAQVSGDGGNAGGSNGSRPVLHAQQGAGGVPLPPGSLTLASATIPVEQAPSLEHFLLNFMMRDGGPVPVVLRGAMTAWPALTKWQDLNYFSKVAGRRTVPVEVGSHYLADGFGTRLMPLDDFLAALTGTPGPGQDSAAGAPVAHAPDPQQQQGEQQQPLLYLAQHQLFEQIPALAADILTPDYCMLGERGGVSSVNAWFGPAGTVTPLHQDPEHNLLAQVVGRKYVRLYDPACTQQLYPHAAGMHTNTSQVDVEHVDAARFPAFSAAVYRDVVLQPGDMLYMPPRWWHFVKALSLSFSVSFWWS